MNAGALRIGNGPIDNLDILRITEIPDGRLKRWARNQFQVYRHVSLPNEVFDQTQNILCVALKKIHRIQINLYRNIRFDTRRQPLIFLKE